MIDTQSELKTHDRQIKMEIAIPVLFENIECARIRKIVCGEWHCENKHFD